MKYPTKYNSAKFSNLFDITGIHVVWLSSEDKKLYNLQILSKGNIGYTTLSTVNVHPSKKINSSSLPSTSKESSTTKQPSITEELSYTVSTESDNSEDDYTYEAPRKLRRRKYSSTSILQ